MEETLVFTTLFQLPNTLKKEEKVLHAEAVITKLGLTKCKNNTIGDPFLRGIFSGESKRVSIGQEMLINPSLLLLDEPTLGLDSTMAQRIVSTLWELANGERTVVMTIHQSSSRLFYMFQCFNGGNIVASTATLASRITNFKNMIVKKRASFLPKNKK
ncbi:hypothetical protein SLE2022_005250 [Rubroshorea leprosula]